MSEQSSPRPVRELIFIFAADQGAMAVIKDSITKVLKLKGCSLCSITHGLLGEKEEMKNCRAELGVPVDYRHRDELAPAMRDAAGAALPVVLARTDEGYTLLLNADVLDRCTGNVSALRGKLQFHAGRLGLDLPMSAKAN